MSAHRHARVTLGRVSGVFGVKGWLKVQSYTEPRDNILRFRTWTLCAAAGEKRFRVVQGRSQGGSAVAKLEGLDDRDEARAWLGAEIVVERSELPPLGADEVYWMDLVGLTVRTTDDQVLGTVDYLLATGAHDVLVVAGDRERLIPFVADRVVKRVDLDDGVIVVDWLPDY